MSEPIRTATEHDGQVERIVLDVPKGNVLDGAMMSAIRAHVALLREGRQSLKLLVFEGAGKHFSFGASVEEHQADRVAGMLDAFHCMFRELEALSVPLAAVVRGQCLGGGMELVVWCGRVFCDASARFGVPESKLAVFPPIAALALPWRVGGPEAVRMILSGDSVPGERAAQIGLADECSDDPEAALQSFVTEHLLPKSAVAVRFGWRAARRGLARELDTELPLLERMYLDELMTHDDPKEGIAAFVERRDPKWRHQ